MPRQGIVLSDLGGDGFPVLNYGKHQSLAYLFDTNSHTSDVYAFPNADGLFQQDDLGYYYYNSNANYAEYDRGANKFVLYEHTYSQNTGGSNGSNAKPIGFFPFHEYDTVDTQPEMNFSPRSPVVVGIYEELALPNFLWVMELYHPVGYAVPPEQRRAFAEVVLDTSASGVDNAMEKVVFMRYPRRMYLRFPDGVERYIAIGEQVPEIDRWVVPYACNLAHYYAGKPTVEDARDGDTCRADERRH